MSSARVNWVGGNWKCNGTRESVAKLVEIYNSMCPLPEGVEVVCAPTALHVGFVLEHMQKEVGVAVQNSWSSPKGGAYTGELTPDIVKDFGAQWVILGHSERRNTVARESPELVADKVKIALDTGLKVVLCVGELKEEREGGKTMEVLIGQMTPVVAKLAPSDWANVVLAYEPVWAIGTGLTATPEVAQETHRQLREWVASSASADVASALRIVYGGSVKAANSAELISQPDIDGFLVGGASLTEEFCTIVRSAKL
eukprot:CAMPEP_0196770454 /NCGR_PEP_ID=MMETSP1104-20130614/1143_1 /TAXON_ID=33652 /ORGANISM="Cafeteria sp., Strain Caron Lab Isolate" /LENGTH=255 /DNA_ID=CAMNT_0042140567 /DNA_START=22 /DNA_END=789 /DNA_ORIENTATION=+